MLMYPLLRVYIRRLSPHLRRDEKHTSLISSRSAVVAVSTFPSRSPARTDSGREGLRNPARSSVCTDRQAIRFLGSAPPRDCSQLRLHPKGVRGIALHQLHHCITFDRLHRTARTDTMSSLGNGASGASGTGPASGYTLNLLRFSFIMLFSLIFVMNLNTCTFIVFTGSLTIVMIIIYLNDFGIKFTGKCLFV